VKILKYLVLSVVLMSLVQCASAVQSNLEAAQFALDASDFDSAITHATNALTDDPDNIEAARILASAYLGRSGIDFLDLAEGIVDLESSDVSNLQQIADVLPATADMDDVRSAVETLEAIDGIDDATLATDELKDAAFDLSIMQIIEHFALGVYGSSYFSAFDPTGISDDQRSSVQGDLVDFDNRLIASGVDSAEGYIDEIRQTLCILEPLSTGEGFTQSEYQAFVGCQLDDDPTTFDTAAIDPTIADCSVVDPGSQSAAVEACYDEDTAL
jgi:hypothetical protein